MRLSALALVLAHAGQLAAQTPRPVEPVRLTDIRGMKFCEFLLIFDDRVDIYNTSNAEGCPEEEWQAADPASIAAAHGATTAQLNGPHYWVMDEQIVGLGEIRTFGGIAAGYAATLPLSALGSGIGADPYKPYISAKDQTMVFEAGKPVYELVDPEGNVYIMNAYGDEVQNGDPANLVGQLTPAEGWSFRVRTPNETLTIEGSSDSPVHMVGDDLHQYYTLIQSGE